MIEQLGHLAVPFVLICLVVAALVELSKRATFLAWSVRGNAPRPGWWRQLWRVLSIVYGFGAGALASVIQGSELWEQMALGAGAGLMATMIVALMKRKIKAEAEEGEA